MYLFFCKLLEPGPTPLVRRMDEIESPASTSYNLQRSSASAVAWQLQLARLQPTICSFSHNNNELNKQDARLHPTTFVDDASDGASGNASNASNASHSDS